MIARRRLGGLALAASPADPEVRATLALAALEPIGGMPQDFSCRLEEEGETWLATARKYGIGRS